MSNRLAMLAAVLVLVVVAAAPALAQNEVPVCEFDDACLDASEEQGATADQYAETPEPGQVPPAPEVPIEDSNDDQYAFDAQNSASEAALAAPASCGSCGLQVAQSAQDVIIGDGLGGADPADTFGAALQAARDAGVTRRAAASEESSTPVEETPVYRAAFEAAKEAGADDETAKKAAEQAVAEAHGDGATNEDGKDRKERASEDETTEDASNDENVVASDEEDSGTDSPGSGSQDTVTTSAGNKAPLLLGGVAFLSVGGLAAVRFARSWSSFGSTRLPWN